MNLDGEGELGGKEEEKRGKEREGKVRGRVVEMKGVRKKEMERNGRKMGNKTGEREKKYNNNILAHLEVGE